MNKKTTLLLLTLLVLLLAVAGYSAMVADTDEPLPPSDPGVTLESASPAEITDEEVEQLGL